MLLYLNALSEELFIKYPNDIIDILILGGSSIVLTSGFRNSTEDIDASTTFNKDIASSIATVTERYSLPHDWLNFDVVKSKSFSVRLYTNCIFYQQIFNLRIYTPCNLDLLCMKLTCFRDKDIADINNLVSLLRDTLSENLLTTRLLYLYNGDYNLSDNAIRYVRYLCLPR